MELIRAVEEQVGMEVRAGHQEITQASQGTAELGARQVVRVAPGVMVVLAVARQAPVKTVSMVLMVVLVAMVLEEMAEQ